MGVSQTSNTLIRLWIRHDFEVGVYTDDFLTFDSWLSIYFRILRLLHEWTFYFLGAIPSLNLLKSKRSSPCAERRERAAKRERKQLVEELLSSGHLPNDCFYVNVVFLCWLMEIPSYCNSVKCSRYWIFDNHARAYEKVLLTRCKPIAHHIRLTLRTLANYWQC